MTKREKTQRDNRDDKSSNMFKYETELQDILTNKIKEYRNKGFTWGEIHFELFRLCSDIAYDVEEEEIKESVDQEE